MWGGNDGNGGMDNPSITDQMGWILITFTPPPSEHQRWVWTDVVLLCPKGMGDQELPGLSLELFFHNFW